jgi:hypothetical protein
VPESAPFGGGYVSWKAGANFARREVTPLDARVLGGWLGAGPRVGIQLGLSVDLR